MKKFLLRSLYFVLYFTFFSIIINAGFLLFISRTDWDFKKRLETLRFENPDYELLAMGSSLTEYGIDTKLLTSKGMKSFNLGLVGSSVRTSYIQLSEYLDNYSYRPSYVLLVVNSNLERLDTDGIQPVVDFTMKGHKFGIKDVPISKFRWAGMEILKKVLRRDYGNTYVSYGQKKAQYVEPDTSSYSFSYLDIQKYETSYWMGEIARLSSQNDVRLIIVDIPGVKSTQNISEIGPFNLEFENGSTAELYNFNNQDFCKYIDVNSDWCGRSHFNEVGAAKFTERLFRDIRTW